jgi:hypothetical protein
VRTRRKYLARSFTTGAFIHAVYDVFIEHPLEIDTISRYTLKLSAIPREVFICNTVVILLVVLGSGPVYMVTAIRYDITSTIT